MKAKGKKVVLLTGLTVVVLTAITAWLYRGHIRFWWLFESLGNNEKGLPEYRHRQTGILMVRVPGAVGEDVDIEPLMFSGEDVVVEAFLIAKNQLRRSEWKRALTANKPEAGGVGETEESFYDIGPTVEEIVSGSPIIWAEREKFCDLTGLSLPTKLQWAYVYSQRESCGVAFPRGLVFEWGRERVCSNLVRISDEQASPSIYVRPAFYPLP